MARYKIVRKYPSGHYYIKQWRWWLPIWLKVTYYVGWYEYSDCHHTLEGAKRALLLLKQTKGI